MHENRIEIVDLPPVSALGWWRAIWPVFISFMLLPVGVVWMTTSLASAAAQNPQPTSGSVVPSILLMIGGPFLMVGFGLFWMWRNQRIARRNQWTAFSERPENAAFAEPIEKFFLLRARWSLGSFGREQTASAAAAATALRAGCASRIALAPPSIAPLLELHAAPVGLLEPEEIGHSFSKQQALMVLLPLLWTGNSAAGYVLRNDPIGIVGIMLLTSFCICALFAIAWFTSVLGERFISLKTTRGIVRAGPGWVDDRMGRRWTVEDSVLIIRALTPAKNSNYHAILLGPQGFITIPIARGRGPAFVNLWQRWTTSEPRLELAGEAARVEGGSIRRGWRTTRRTY